MFYHLLLFVRAEVQEDVQVLKLPGGTFNDELLQSGHAQIHPRLKHKPASVDASGRRSATASALVSRLYLVLAVTPDHVQCRFCDNGSLEYQFSEKSADTTF